MLDKTTYYLAIADESTKVLTWMRLNDPNGIIRLERMVKLKYSYQRGLMKIKHQLPI